MHAHTHTLIHTHPVSWAWFSQSFSRQSFLKKGNHKETAAAADTLSLPDSGFLFLHLSSPHQNTEGFKNDNYQEGGVQLFNRKTSGSEVSKGCLAVPTSKLLCSSTLTAITANWKGKNPNLWCLESAAALMMRSRSLPLSLNSYSALKLSHPNLSLLSSYHQSG